MRTGYWMRAAAASALLATAISGCGIARPQVVVATPAQSTSPPLPDLRLKSATNATAAATAIPLDDGPYRKPLAIAFPTAAHGVLLAEICDPRPGGCRVFTETSSDGGSTWSAPVVIASGPWPADGADPADLAVSTLAFANQNDGYAYGPELYVTHDGGAAWRAIAAPGQVHSVDAISQPPLLILGACVNAADCAPSRLASIEGDRVVERAAELPGPSAQLVSVDAQTAYMVGRNGMVETRDGGVTWTGRKFPASECAASLSAAAHGDLWLVCAGEPTSGMMTKDVWRSGDDGVTWRGPLPTEAYGYASNVVTAGKESAWRFGGRGQLWRTDDGGRSWHALKPVGYGDGGGTPNGFAAVGPDRAWLLDDVGPAWTGPHKLYSTSDAGHSWHVVDVLPPELPPMPPRDVTPATSVLPDGWSVGAIQSDGQASQFAGLTVANAWTTVLNGYEVEVYAGSTEATAAGEWGPVGTLVVRTIKDPQTHGEFAHFTAPELLGPWAITGVTGNVLALVAADGRRFTFDADRHVFGAPN
ncbi:MAG: hypothetical protein QOH99_1254 [Frankiaceae bacterium]|nr:hypothetical protein [Frankiaceae bacterium]